MERFGRADVDDDIADGVLGTAAASQALDSAVLDNETAAAADIDRNFALVDVEIPASIDGASSCWGQLTVVPGMDNDLVEKCSSDCTFFFSSSFI